MPTSSIDDLLIASASPQQPATPEYKNEQALIESEADVPRETAQAPEPEQPEAEVSEPQEQPVASENIDEYGNENTKSRTYTQDEVNAMIRDRVSRFERNNQPRQQQETTRQQQQEPEGGWEQQLESFIEQTIHKRTQKEAREAQAYKEQQAMAELEHKFSQGMQRFPDYVETMQGHNVTDTMVRAAAAMKDPAAFFYAAAKRAPAELARIANIQDPYAQVVEIARLEEKMKMTKRTTATPSPLSKTADDSAIPEPRKPRELSIEEKIEADKQRRMAFQRQRRG